MNRWTAERAAEWYGGEPWLVGCNFIPSTAVNQLEMWQAATFDAPAIERETGWAAEMGLNVVRVYLHDLAWSADAQGLKTRMDRFLRIAAAQGIRTIFVIFDDCWNEGARVGPQPSPVSGIHNSGWLQSPGVAAVNAPATWPRLQCYVRDVVGTFGRDERVLMWDLYNEPGNSAQNERSLLLLRMAFEWARAAEPLQPLTAGLWNDNPVLNGFQTAASDVITFHNYHSPERLAAQIKELRRHGRPLICTEWLRRGHSDVGACLPVFHRERVGCCNWGLVCGKTQTIFPWGSKEGSPEPAVWFHDLLRKDGSPFNAEEIRLFKGLTVENRNRGTTGREQK